MADDNDNMMRRSVEFLDKYIEKFGGKREDVYPLNWTHHEDGVEFRFDEYSPAHYVLYRYSVYVESNNKARCLIVDCSKDENDKFFLRGFYTENNGDKWEEADLKSLMAEMMDNLHEGLA